MESTKKEFVVCHESLLESWLKDIVTFGSIAILLYANHRWFGDHASVAVLLVLLMVVFGIGKASRSIKNFYDKDEAKKYIDNL